MKRIFIHPDRIPTLQTGEQFDIQACLDVHNVGRPLPDEFFFHR